MKLGEKVKSLFEASELSINDLCHEIGISDPTYYRIVRTNKTDTDTLDSIAKYFSVKKSWFLEEDESSPKNYQYGIGNISGDNNSQKIMEDAAQYERRATSENKEAFMYMQKLVQAQDELLKCKDQVIGLLQKQA